MKASFSIAFFVKIYYLRLYKMAMRRLNINEYSKVFV